VGLSSKQTICGGLQAADKPFVAMLISCPQLMPCYSKVHYIREMADPLFDPPIIIIFILFYPWITLT